ncbi:uncharacterized protein LOC127135791 [Lathyrus oleraceus]|uniref:uncharacterized protein LOC127135791 n=1 Tax=Pisum sativum TaxID=3888 RepID=UPI0021D0736A|nr:uncharacterized protein LOC127135791 [Pisum sativum]
MTGRNDRTIADALTALAQVLQARKNPLVEDAESHGLDRFQINKTPTFKERYDPEGAQVWLQEIEKIFRVMACADAQKEFEANGIALTWAILRDAFLEKYFPANVRSKKEIEFLELKQGNMTVVDYAAKFEEFSRFYPHYNRVEAEVSKCIKFENGLRPEIKPFIGYQEIRQFSMLVNKCCIYDEDSRARYAHFKSVSEKKNENQIRGKPYAIPVAKEDHKTHQDTASGKGTSSEVLILLLSVSSGKS